MQSFEIGDRVIIKGTDRVGMVLMIADTGNGYAIFIKWDDDGTTSTYPSSHVSKFEAVDKAPRVSLKQSDYNTKCVLCGSPALDLIFSVECSNSQCRNYK